VAKKLNLQFLLYLRYMWGEGVGWKRHIMVGGGWLKTSEYHHTGVKGSKIVQKNRHWYLNVPLVDDCDNQMRLWSINQKEMLSYILFEENVSPENYILFLSYPNSEISA